MQIDKAIGEIYRSAASPALFVKTIFDINTLIGSEFVHLLGWDETNPDMCFSAFSQPGFQEASSQYAAYYHAIDPRKKAADALPAGTLIPCWELIDPKAKSHHALFNDLLYKYDIKYTLGTTLQNTPHSKLYLVFNKMQGQAVFDNEAMKMAKIFIYHLKTAYQILLDNQHRNMADCILSSEPDYRTACFFAISAGNHICYTNLKESNPLYYLHSVIDQLLKPGKSDSSQKLQFQQRLHYTRKTGIMQNFIHTENSTGIMNELIYCEIMSAPTHLSNNGANLAKAEEQFGSIKPVADLYPFHNVDIIIKARKVSKYSTSRPESLASAFGFTPAESILAIAISSGISLEDFAQDKKISINTVRTQVRSLLAKSGQKNIQNLIALLARI